MRASGYAYIEILIAVALIVFSLAPMLESLANGVAHQGRQGDYADGIRLAQARLQTLQAEPYAALAAEAAAAGGPGIATAYSDPVTSSPRILVNLALYDQNNADGDGDPLTGGDAGLLWLRVATERGDVEYFSLRNNL